MQAIYIPELDDDFMEIMEEITPQDQELVIPMFYMPTLDSLTRQMSSLNSLRYFISSSPAIVWNFYELFPNITDHILNVSMGSDSLRHSLLALTAIIRDLFSGNMNEVYLVEKTTSLRFLQDAISSDSVDEAIAIAVMMHMGMDVLLGQLRHTRNHLKGAYLILQRLKEKAWLSGKGLSPLGLLIQRMMIRLDASLTSLWGDTTEFESLDPAVEIEDRKWLTTNQAASKHMSSTNIEWTLASFEMDNLQHRAYNAAKRAQSWRQVNDPQMDEKIQMEYRKLVQGMDMWKQRAIVREQEEIERYARQVNKPSDDPQLRFLHHEPLYIQNTFFAKLLNQWRMQSISNSLMVSPKSGPEPLSHNRYTLAVDICRTHAALGKEAYIGPSWQSLFYAGMVFGGKMRYPLESEWIMERLRIVAAGFPSVRLVIESMPLQWEDEMSHWNGFAVWFRYHGLLDS